MVIDRDTIIKLHKNGESNTSIAKKLQLNRTTVWKIVKKYMETGSTAIRPGRGRKRSVRTPLLLENTREELCQNPYLSCRQLAIEANISRSTMHRLIKEDLSMRIEKNNEITERTVSNMMFTDEKKNDIPQAVYIPCMVCSFFNRKTQEQLNFTKYFYE